MTSDEWIEWKNSTLTKTAFEALREEQENQKQNWADGKFPLQRDNDVQIGFIQGLDFVINGGFITEEIDEE